ncbi:dihydropteroate synthase [Shewanella eurypsychrophilus]|uniref:Dihydropteroate synthase n=1 Tax=Shewanella eurypsychrophilus TaxID=2593656 RepID=A0ABX6VCA7_9GAMM|nr:MULTISPECIES: dihydropteroate synthase [Shewanella]QFU23964.1 dihydropteroate synthase [Shewanella sp. YLB-09]QPG59180.1 dihydropteroate synthase [Shewanella eurypsychrophilus]
MFQICSGQRTLELTSPVVMGILNVTPDSFSDGGQFSSFDLACQHADAMVEQGAKIIDIGGESTRPGAADVTLTDELNRVIPLIQYVASHHDVWISIDTSKPKVMEQAILAGAHMINDVRALQEPDAVEVAAKLNVPVCLMHMQGRPRTMQHAPEYQDVIGDIAVFFEQRLASCLKAGIKREHILLDPGFGFGKTLVHNYEILNRLAELKALELPLLIGLSRKSMMGSLLNRAPQERLAGSLAGAILAAQQGANILRVHDVAETVDILKVMSATEEFNQLA